MCGNGVGVFEWESEDGNALRDKDTETIQAIIKASTPMTPVEDANVSIMKAILPELLKNPSSMNALLELGEMANKGKK